MSEELVDLTVARTKVREFCDAGSPEYALTLLDQIARWPDTTRYLDDNLWLYRQIGDLHLTQSSPDDAMTAYRRGYELDPRDLGILKPYSDLLFASNLTNDGVKVVQSMLLHHKHELGSTELSAIYAKLGSLYEADKNFTKARSAFEKSLENTPTYNDALEGLLRVIGQVADPVDVIRVRQKLINSLEDPKSRSIALVALGNDWVNEFNDSGRALDVFEHAVLEWKENEEALSRIATVGAEVGDWRRVGRAYFTLSELTEDETERAEWIYRSSIVARDHLWEADKALNGFRRVLQLDPNRIDAFKAITSILFDAKDWEEVETSHLSYIATLMEQPDASPELLSILWQKLGELYEGTLMRPDDAIFAFGQCSQYRPEDNKIRESVIALTESHEDHFDKAISQLRALYDRNIDTEKTLERMGKVFMRMKSFDRALGVFRAMQIQNFQVDAQTQAFVEKFNTPMFRPIKRSLTESMLTDSIFHEKMDARINRVFHYLHAGLSEWTGESQSNYGLKRRDHVKIEEPLAFNNIYKSIGGSINYNDLPKLWHKKEQTGLINGALIPEGLIAGDEILGSGREEFMAFVIAKQLFLFQPSFYLPTIRPSDVNAFFVLGASYVLPDVRLEMNKELESALKSLRKKIKGPNFDQLRRAYENIGGEADIPFWIETIEDTANRVGFLFSDDLNSCKKYLENEPQKITSRSLEERMKSVVDFSVSEKYFNLRDTLGLSIG